MLLYEELEPTPLSINFAVQSIAIKLSKEKNIFFINVLSEIILCSLFCFGWVGSPCVIRIGVLYYNLLVLCLK